MKTPEEFINEYYQLPQSKIETVRIKSLIRCLEKYKEYYEINEIWINIEKKRPTEQDGLILVTNGNIVEIVYYSEKEEELMKPWRYDKNDHPVLKISQVKLWQKIDIPEVPIGVIKLADND